MWRFFEIHLSSGIGQLAAIQTLAPSLGVELRPVDTRNASEIERDITAFAQGANGGLIVTGSPAAVAHRKVIIMMATRHRLPAVYSYPLFVTQGGLIAYGPDRWIVFDVPLAMWTVFLRGKTLRTCRCKRQPNSRSLSTS